MLSGIFRSPLKPLVALLASPFIALRIHPTWVTLLGIPFALACAYAYATHQYGLALLLLPLATLWDALDGTVARALKKQSLWGNYFETMIDKLVESADRSRTIRHLPDAGGSPTGIRMEQIDRLAETNPDGYAKLMAARPDIRRLYLGG